MTPILSFGRHILNQVEMGVTKEWIETNGLGSYAMGTVLGINTRRHHALFVMTSPSNLNRTVCVNRVEESVLVNGRKVDCFCQEYPGAISPQGYLHLESFSFDPFPSWVYSIDDLKLQKTFFMRTGEQTSVLIYKHLIGSPVKLMLRPFFSCRDHQLLAHEDQRFKNAIQIGENSVRCSVTDQPEFFTTAIAHPGVLTQTVKIFQEGYWYKNLVYAQDEEMGLDYQEDLFSPVKFQVELSAGQQVALIFSDQALNHIEIGRWVEQEHFIRNKILENFSLQGAFARRCAIAADQFVIRDRENRFKVIQGYPWQTDTIRESLMSLPGIFLATGQLEQARSLLTSCSQLIYKGLLPRAFSNAESSEYDNMDSALWFVWAVQKYWETTKNADFLNEMRPHLENIIQSFIQGIKIDASGRKIQVQMDGDGLIYGNSVQFPLTWMNQRTPEWIATPRRGKPVEVQALWYNALQFCSEISLKLANTDHGWSALAKKSRENFNTLFWNPQNNYLYDVIDGNLREGSIRPNALYAVSMPYEILENSRFKPVVETAWKILYTSLGLRTLSPSEPHYHGTHTGDPKTRAAAAHNGTVSPFFIGPFLTAFFKAFGQEEGNKEKAICFLRPFVSHLSDAGLGNFSEFFDGNSPHHPRGAVADVRVAAEILRVMKEEGLEL